MIEAGINITEVPHHLSAARGIAPLDIQIPVLGEQPTARSRPRAPVANPMPRLDPVISTTLPASFRSMSPFPERLQSLF